MLSGLELRRQPLGDSILVKSANVPQRDVVLLVEVDALLLLDEAVVTIPLVRSLVETVTEIMIDEIEVIVTAPVVQMTGQ